MFLLKLEIVKSFYIISLFIQI